MKKSNKKPSNFAPIFIASTAVFFLGSAFRFIFGSKQEHPSQPSAVEEHIQDEDIQDEDEIDDENPQEPEEDPVKSL